VLEGMYSLLHLRLHDYLSRSLVDIKQRLQSIDELKLAPQAVAVVLESSEAALNKIQAQLTKIILLENTHNTLLEVRALLSGCMGAVSLHKQSLHKSRQPIEPECREEKKSSSGCLFLCPVGLGPHLFLHPLLI
jgi:hypothetical protein